MTLTPTTALDLLMKRPSWTTMSLRTTALDLNPEMLKLQHPKFTQNPPNGNINELPTRRS
jgi:hypothetical protein